MGYYLDIMCIFWIKCLRHYNYTLKCTFHNTPSLRRPAYCVRHNIHVHSKLSRSLPERKGSLWLLQCHFSEMRHWRKWPSQIKRIEERGNPMLAMLIWVEEAEAHAYRAEHRLSWHYFNGLWLMRVCCTSWQVAGTIAAIHPLQLQDVVRAPSLVYPQCRPNGHHPSADI